MRCMSIITQNFRRHFKFFKGKNLFNCMKIKHIGYFISFFDLN